MNAAGNGKTYGKTGQNNRDIHFDHIIYSPFLFLKLNQVRQLDRLPECPLLISFCSENNQLCRPVQMYSLGLSVGSRLYPVFASSTYC